MSFIYFNDAKNKSAVTDSDDPKFDKTVSATFPCHVFTWELEMS